MDRIPSVSPEAVSYTHLDVYKRQAPIGAGTYVLAEMKAPTGYVRTDPVAVEVYSDSVEYYKDGDRFSKVPATVYTENIIK